MSREPDVSVVVPVYKEEHSIGPFLDRIVPVLEQIGEYEILFCLDPSPDRTETAILDHVKKNPRVGLLNFSRRFGQPAATMAGIMNCRGKTCVVIDVDLQDPPELIAELHAKVSEGFDVVYAQRRTRAGETFVKRVISEWGYTVINAIADVQIPRNTGDFRIMTRRVVEELRRLSETHGFLRGLVALVGFRQTAVQYDRAPRLAGEGKYNRLTGSFKIGFNGIIGFSTKPLSALMWSGLFVAAVSFLLAVAMVVTKLFLNIDYPTGIPTITVLVLFLGGVQLAGLGLIGEYIGRIYEEVRRRPLYIVDQATNVQVRDSHGPNSGNLAVPKPVTIRPVVPNIKVAGETDSASPRMQQ